MTRQEPFTEGAILVPYVLCVPSFFFDSKHGGRNLKSQIPNPQSPLCPDSNCGWGKFTPSILSILSTSSKPCLHSKHSQSNHLKSPILNPQSPIGPQVLASRLQRGAGYFANENMEVASPQRPERAKCYSPTLFDSSPAASLLPNPADMSKLVNDNYSFPPRCLMLDCYQDRA